MSEHPAPPHDPDLAAWQWLAKWDHPYWVTGLVLLAMLWAMADARNEGREVNFRLFSSPYKFTHYGWPFSDASRNRCMPPPYDADLSWDYTAGTCNLLICVAILAATAYASESWLRREKSEPLSVADLGVWTFVTAVLVSLRVGPLDPAWEPSLAYFLHPRNYLLLAGMTALVYCGTWQIVKAVDARLFAWEQSRAEEARAKAERAERRDAQMRAAQRESSLEEVLASK